MALNAAAWEALGKPNAVELLYDGDARRMGFRAGDPNAAHAYRLRGTGDGTSRTLSGKAFLQYYGVSFEEAQRFAAQLDGEGVLAVDLDASEPVPPLRRPPSKTVRAKHPPRG
jgi:hypothetical protein